MDDAHIQELLQTAVQERRAGRVGPAMALFRQVLGLAGEHPVALNALALHALGQGDCDDATALFRRAIAADPVAPELWMNLAKARREHDDDAGEEAALNGALEIDQLHFMALVRMAELLERRGDAARAADRWNGVLAMAPGIDTRTPALDAMLEHARDFVTKRQDQFGGAIDDGLSVARDAIDPVDRQRVDACIEHALGRRAIYTNQCAGMHFPFLPADEFFARDHFPWLSDIEAQTDAIRAELLAILAKDSDIVRPYIEIDPGTPTNKWSGLDGSLDWGSIHLWKDGTRCEEACRHAPITAAAIEALPLSDLPGRTPTVFFSLLRPGAHLPAHTGVSNVRTIIHLPLIVPADCVFRVGGETRDWRVGQAWAFDDTIEHEAWNRSNEMRVILIFDVWNPYITPVERDLLRRFYSVAATVDASPDAALRVSD